MQFHLGFSNNLCHDLTGRHRNHRQIPNHINNKQAEIESRNHQRHEGQEAGLRLKQLRIANNTCTTLQDERTKDLQRGIGVCV